MKPDNSQIQFLGTKVKESHIVFKEKGSYTIDLDFIAKGLIRKSSSVFILTIDVKINDIEDKFLINISSESEFSFSNDIDIEKYKESYFVLNAPAIVFPYIRSYISALTSLSGMPTLTLPTLNLTAIGEQLQNNIKEED
jgi:preprotein translocase subunit SecB